MSEKTQLAKETHITIQRTLVGAASDSNIQISRRLPNNRIRRADYRQYQLSDASARRLLRVLRLDAWKQSFELDDLVGGTLYLTFCPVA